MEAILPEKKNSKVYSAIKNRILIFEIFFNLALLSLFSFSSLTMKIEEELFFRIGNDYLRFIAFILIIGAVFTATGLLIDYYNHYIIEHDFNLSNQTFVKWVLENIKSILLNTILFIPLSLLFYYLLRKTGANWWIYFGSAVFIFSVILAQLAPILILPLFYKFTKIDNDDIYNKINELCTKYNTQFSEIYEFNMSKNTKKANAAFTGLAKTKRIILSDTLIQEFTPDEIQIIFAHELGHNKKRHIIKNLILSAFIIFFSFFICNKLFIYTTEFMNIDYLLELRAIPLLVLYITVFGFLIMPFTNMISRYFEREADSFALESTQNPDAFISSMEKLSKMNLSDKEPNPIFEFIFHSHPSIKKRIIQAEKFKLKNQ